MMVSKVFIVLLTIVCAVAATGKPKELFDQVTIESMQKTLDNLNAAIAKNKGIKTKHETVKKEHDGIKTKSEAAEALLKKYNGEPTESELKFSDKELADKKTTEKKIAECEVKVKNVENEVIPLREELKSLERRLEELKQEKIQLEKEISELKKSIESYRGKVRNMREVEIPDVKRRIDENSRNYHGCIDVKLWNPSVMGNFLAMWNSSAHQYIATNINMSDINFTMGLFINAPFNGTYQTIYTSTPQWYGMYSNNRYRIELAVQNNHLMFINGGQSTSVPFTNGLVFIIILQTQQSAIYYVNGIMVASLNHYWNYPVGHITFSALNNGGIKDLSIISKVLTEPEIHKFSGYFAYKWYKKGDSLPSNHPYKEEMPYK